MRRVLMVVLGICALAILPADRAVVAGPTPERIVSWRVRILPRERYAELRKEWETYTKSHPDDPVGWAELTKASRYSGVPCREYLQYAEKAVRLGPDNADACATLGSLGWSTYCGSAREDPSESIRLLEHALQLDPSLDDPRYTLWVMLLSQGKSDQATAQLAALLDGGRMPEPLVDFGYNLLVGLEPKAILLTNGDNDTYPPVALQAARKFRTDVAVVNLSLLNLEWYRRQLREGPLAVPVPLSFTSSGASESATESDRAVKELVENLRQSGWKRPLYAAVTVAGIEKLIPNRLSLEGIVYRVLPTTGGEPEIDAQRMARNLDKLYRLESVNSVALDWDAWSSLRGLIFNYCAAATRVAPILAKAGDVAGARKKMAWSLDVCESHHCDPAAIRTMISGWSQWDSKSPEFSQWRRKYGR